MKRPPIASRKPRSSLHGGNGDQDKKEVHKCWIGDDPDDNEDEESPCRAGSQWWGDEVEYVWHGICEPANRPPPPTLKYLMDMMFSKLLFS